MHKLFAEWYRIARIEPAGDDLPKRWSGVEALVPGLTAPKAVDMARLFFGCASVGADAKEQIALVFQKSDPAFPMRDNDLELRVLAGAFVVHYLETQRTAAGDALALAVVSGAFPGVRTSIQLGEIIDAAQAYLFNEGLKIRGHSPVPEIKGVAKTEQLLTGVTTYDGLAAPLQKLSTALAKSANETVSHLNSEIAAVLEQGNVLWWVFAGISRDVDRAYSELDLSQACLLAGKELADLTQLLPGPVAAPAVVEKVLAATKGSNANVSVESAVTSATSEWKQKCLEGFDGKLDDLCPLHQSFRRSADGGSWLRAVETSCGIKAKKDTTGRSIAMQMYTERLLKKAVLG